MLRNVQKIPSFCCECFHPFGCETDLVVHYNTFHKGLKPFFCPVCSKRFSENEKLRLHFQTVHEGSPSEENQMFLWNNIYLLNKCFCKKKFINHFCLPPPRRRRYCYRGSTQGTTGLCNSQC